MQLDDPPCKEVPVLMSKSPAAHSAGQPVLPNASFLHVPQDLGHRSSNDLSSGLLTVLFHPQKPVFLAHANKWLHFPVMQLLDAHSSADCGGGAD